MTCTYNIKNDKFNSFSENNSSKQLNYSNDINTTKKLEEISKKPAIIVTQEVEKKVKKQKKKKKLNIDNLHKNVRKLHPKEKPKKRVAFSLSAFTIILILIYLSKASPYTNP